MTDDKKPKPEVIAIGYIYRAHAARPPIFYSLGKRDEKLMARNHDLIRVRIVRDE
jgi:hypothetical protein